MFEVSRMHLSLILLLVMLAYSSSAQAAPYDPYPWCAAYGGSWSGTSNCGFKTLQQCMATVSGIGGSCEPNQFYNPGRLGRRAKAAKPPNYGSYYGSGYGSFAQPILFLQRLARGAGSMGEKRAGIGTGPRPVADAVSVGRDDPCRFHARQTMAASGAVFPELQCRSSGH